MPLTPTPDPKPTSPSKRTSRHVSKPLGIAILLIVTSLAAAGLAGVSSTLASAQRDCTSPSHFESPQALAAFLRTAPSADTGGGWLGFGWGFLSGPGAPTTTGTAGPGTGTTTADSTGGRTDSFSGTNNQVAGVDEADITKTDGQRIYTVSSGAVAILDAYPAQTARVLSRIPVTGTVLGLFVNGDRLVVFTAEAASSSYPDFRYYHGYASGPTRIDLYDIADPSAPQLARSVSVSGSYVGSRMIGDYVYLVAQEYAQESGGAVALPTITAGGTKRTLTAPEVGYFKDSEGGRIATVTALRITGDDAPAYVAFLVQYTSQIYVSAGNVYLAGYGYEGGGTWTQPTEWSTIHRVAIDGGSVAYACSFRVPGTILNQFSMDEYNGYLRVATTIGHVSAGGSSSQNNVYVADAGLNPVGKLEGLAPGEQIHSARFMGDRAYLVTFKKIDPLFVIDLSNPRAPRVLGYLKVPGYSDYLHPYDATHVIGVGKDAVDMGDFAWYQGLKVSLFDVSDVEHPTEVATYGIGDRGTDSEALRDHKAFLFIPERSLVVLPVQLYEVNRTQYPGEVPPSTYGEFVWQGAYVLSVTLDGIELKGRVTHGMDSGGYGYPDGGGAKAIRRSLYIEDVLYTVSLSTVRMNGLGDLSDLGGVAL